MVDSGCDAEHLRQYCDSYRTQPVIPLRTLKRKPKPRPSCSGAIKCLSTCAVAATVRGYEHGDGRPAVGFDFVFVLCSRLIEAGDHQ